MIWKLYFSWFTWCVYFCFCFCFSPGLLCNWLPRACWNPTPLTGLEQRVGSTCIEMRRMAFPCKITIACEAFTGLSWKKEPDTWAREGKVAFFGPGVRLELRGSRNSVILFTKCHWPIIQVLLISKHCLAFHWRDRCGCEFYLRCSSAVLVQWAWEIWGLTKRNQNKVTVMHNELYLDNTLADLHVGEVMKLQRLWHRDHYSER